MVFIFQAQRVGGKKSAACRLSKAGLLIFGAEFTEQNSLTSGKRVSICYEPETHRIGLRPHAIGESPAGAAKVTQLTRSLGLSLLGTMRRNNIAPGRYVGGYDSDIGLVVL